MRMKRFLAGVALAALTIVLAATVADAAVKYRSGGKVQWRTYKASIVGNEGPSYGVDATGGYVDSLGATIGAIDVQDTSVTWRIPGDFCTPARTDSMPSFIVVWTTYTSSADYTPLAGAAGDTIYATAEPRLGNTWLGAGGVFKQSLAVAGARTYGIQPLFPAATTAYVGAETVPQNPTFVPMLTATGGIRLVTYSDGNAGMVGRWVEAEILYAVCE